MKSFFAQHLHLALDGHLSGMEVLVMLFAIAVIYVIVRMANSASGAKKGTIFRHEKNRYKDSTRKKKNPDGTVRRRGLRKRRR